MIVRLLKEPLLQFLALGAMLFALYGLVGKRSADAPEKIVVSASRIANLGDGFVRTWRRSPTGQELQGLIEDYVRDEVFYREGRAAGLDRDDVIIRRRVRQKMEFLAEDMSVPESSDEQLVAYLASNPERFRTEDQITFRQVFLSAARRANTIESDSKQVASVLARADAAVDATLLGDPFLLGEEFRGVSPNKVTSIFGEDFSKRIAAMETGRWQGPVSSGFGQHFVFISERVSGGLPSLDAIRPAVRREWANARRLEAEQKLYASLRSRYEIVVEAPPAKAASAEVGR
ncbi:MAG TPA: peptidylprolyl isomerase [Bradyrhizobium sp.]|nr:peptidylprolyl isomerase [Bradyrhizobium sp.]